jgi:hypothetical protein
MAKYLTLGVSHMSGIARASGNEYDMKRALVVSEQAPVDTANRTLESIGLNAVPMNLSDACYRKFQLDGRNLDYPLELEFTEDIDLSSGQPRVVFTDVKIPNTSKSA